MVLFNNRFDLTTKMVRYKKLGANIEERYKELILCQTLKLAAMHKLS